MSKNIAQFAREVRQETLKVSWPSRKETVTTTIVVFVMVFLMSMVLLFSDWVISSSIKFILTLGTKF
ncbi:MAG: preprotein translocase subunit SecE [bacterium]|nr:preprotein translocase subunit SecE [bacterium]